MTGEKELLFPRTGGYVPNLVWVAEDSGVDLERVLVKVKQAHHVVTLQSNGTHKELVSF